LYSVRCLSTSFAFPKSASGIDFTNSTADFLLYFPCGGKSWFFGAQKLLTCVSAERRTYDAWKEFIVFTFSHIDLGRITGEWKRRHDGAG
jgi:hypothetical protein